MPDPLGQRTCLLAAGFRRPPNGSTPVLAPEARRVLGIEGSRRPNSASAGAGLLYSKGFYWDEAILYRAGTHWKDSPVSAFWNVRIVPGLEDSLNELH
jgi:hypothetical protein